MIEGDWYDIVYLCIENTNNEKSTIYSPIKGFNCYKFKSFESVDNI